MTERRAFGRIFAASCLLLACLGASSRDALGEGPESGRALALRPKREVVVPGIVSIVKAARWMNRDGYLAEGPPPPLRFSDEDLGNVRAPLPALPEFALVSAQYYPYVVESPLPESLGGVSRYAEVIVDFEPRAFVSGIIDTESTADTTIVESLTLEDSGAAMLRPEEVLIFFESDGRRTKTNAIIPFSPASPSEATIRSSAEYIKE